VELTLAAGEPSAILDAFPERRRPPELIGLYPGRCLVAVEAHLARPLTTLAELGLAFWLESAEMAPASRKQAHYPSSAARPEPELSPELLALLGELDALAGDTFGMSVHALPGEPRSRAARDFIEELLDVELEHADPRLAFYFASPEPEALADGLLGLMAEGAAVRETTFGGVAGRMVERDDGTGLCLLPLGGLLVVAPDEPSASYIAQNLGGAEALAGLDAFRGSPAGTAEPVSLAVWVDVPALLAASQGPESGDIAGMFGLTASGFNVSVSGDRITLEGDTGLLGLIFALFGL